MRQGGNTLEVADAPQPAPPTRERARRGGVQGIYVVLAVVFLLAWAIVALSGGDFLTVDNIRSMLVRSVSLGIVSVGQTLVILAGSIDLSVAYLISTAAVLAGFIMDGDPGKIVLGVTVVLAIGVVVGLANGLMITKLKAHPFIATLGTSLILRGALSSRFSGPAGGVPRQFSDALGYGLVGPVPVSVILMAATVGVAWWLLRKTTFGSHLYAVGGSEEIARLSGVRSDRTLILTHVACSVTAVLTGLYLVARVTSAAPQIGPQGGYDLESIAAVVVGGTALAGGRGGVVGTVAGVFILAILDNVMNALEIDSFLKFVIRGVIIIAAVASYALRSKREVEG